MVFRQPKGPRQPTRPIYNPPTGQIRGRGRFSQEMVSDPRVDKAENAQEVLKKPETKEEWKPEPPHFKKKDNTSSQAPSVCSSSRLMKLELIDSEEEDDSYDRPPPFVRTANGGIMENPARRQQEKSRQMSATLSERGSIKSLLKPPVVEIPDLIIVGNPQPVGISVLDRRYQRVPVSVRQATEPVTQSPIGSGRL